MYASCAYSKEEVSIAMQFLLFFPFCNPLKKKPQDFTSLSTLLADFPVCWPSHLPRTCQAPHTKASLQTCLTVLYMQCRAQCRTSRGGYRYPPEGRSAHDAFATPTLCMLPPTVSELLLPLCLHWLLPPMSMCKHVILHM